MSIAVSSAEPKSLLRHRDFMLLWSGQTASEFGSAVTFLVLPLAAVVQLHATAFEIGALAAASSIPFLLVALPAGAMVERTAKRRVMIAANLVRAVTLGSIPAAAFARQLSLAQLYAVAVIAGVATVFFDIAYQSYLPTLVTRERLIEGNGRLTTTASIAQTAGPGIGGAIAGLLGAAQAILADVASFAVSIATIAAIKKPEASRTSSTAGSEHPRLRDEIAQGLAFVLRHPVLKRIVAATATINLFTSMAFALNLVYLVRVLRVSPGETGLFVSLSGTGGIVGGLTARRWADRIGSGRIIWFSLLVFGTTAFAVPLARPGPWALLYSLGWFGFFMSAVVYNIAQVSYRQAVCPPELLSRMNASVRWIVWGTMPAGNLLGGLLGTLIGVRATMAVAVVGAWSAGWLVYFSPLRTMRTLSEEPDGPAGSL